ISPPRAAVIWPLSGPVKGEFLPHVSNTNSRTPPPPKSKRVRYAVTIRQRSRQILRGGMIAVEGKCKTRPPERLSEGKRSFVCGVVRVVAPRGGRNILRLVTRSAARAHKESGKQTFPKTYSY